MHLVILRYCMLNYLIFPTIQHVRKSLAISSISFRWFWKELHRHLKQADLHTSASIIKLQQIKSGRFLRHGVDHSTIWQTVECQQCKKKVLPRLARTWSRSNSVSRIFCCCCASFSSYCIFIKFFSRSLRFNRSTMFAADDMSVVRSAKLLSPNNATVLYYKHMSEKRPSS